MTFLRIADEFNIYTREAGAGILSVAVEGPSQAKIEVVENANGYTMVSYVVTKEGQLTVCGVEMCGNRFFVTNPSHFNDFIPIPIPFPFLSET